MASLRLPYFGVCCFLCLSFSAGSMALSIQSSAVGHSILQTFSDSSGRCSADEELGLARYLKKQSEAYLKLLNALDIEVIKEEAYLDEESAALLETTISELRISVREIIVTLEMVDTMFKKGPVDYSQSAPLLWLTVIKDISVEKENARQLETMELVRSGWYSMVEIALPNLFSRILEPKLTELLRTPRQ